MVKELRIKEIQKELPNMVTDFYSELAKNYIYSEDHKINNISLPKISDENQPHQTSFRF